MDSILTGNIWRLMGPLASREWRVDSALLMRYIVSQGGANIYGDGDGPHSRG
jgi:hypothetical protein